MTTPDAVELDVVSYGPSIPVSFVGAAAGDVQLYPRACLLTGWSVFNDSGGPGRVDFIDGAPAQNGQLVGMASPANQTVETHTLPCPGVRLRFGLNVSAALNGFLVVAWIVPL